MCSDKEMKTYSLRQNLLEKAAVDLRWLISRRYPKQSALLFVGNHYQLNQRERDLLFRGVFSPEQALRTRQKMIRAKEIEGASLVIDGHNVLITLESALASKLLLLADDGFVRDISRVFRKFRPTARTKRAWLMVEKFLLDYPPDFVAVVLDEPLSKSRELGGRMERWLREAGIKGQVHLSSTPETTILTLPGIKLSADSIVLARAEKIFDIAGHIIRRRLKVNLFTLK